MDIRKAEQVVQQYGRVMERTAAMVHGAPQSLLPCSKDEIKEAIRLVLLLLEASRRGSGDPELEHTREMLRVGYVELARFIPDEEAKIAYLGQSALDSGDINHPGWKFVERTLQISKRISEDQTLLLDELNRVFPG
jgi:hypothetical protein